MRPLARTTSSLPVPVSPLTKTVEEVALTSSTSSSTRLAVNSRRSPTILLRHLSDSQIATDQNKAALSSLSAKFQPNPDRSIDLYFGPKAPVGKETQWIKTTPGKGWFNYFRIYGPQASAFDGRWKLPDIELVN